MHGNLNSLTGNQRLPLATQKDGWAIDSRFAIIFIGLISMAAKIRLHSLGWFSLIRMFWVLNFCMGSVYIINSHNSLCTCTHTHYILYCIPLDGIVWSLPLLDLFLLQQATTHVTMNMIQLIINSEANTPVEAIQAPGINLDPSDTVYMK